MWRHFNKGFQQGLKKSLCLEKQDAYKKDLGARNECCIAKLLPRSFQNIDLSILYQGDGDKYRKDKGKYSTRNISNHTFLEACGWSGAIAFGWVISKQWWLRYKFSQDRESHCNNNNRNTSIVNQNLIDLLAHVVKTQPPVNYVLPLQSLPSEQCCETNKSSNQKKSLDDEFEMAAKDLQEIHVRAIGESLNRRGLAFISKSTGSEAIKYFKRASELKYSPASFNLGLCSELGIGMKQDFKKAAEWYKIATEQGHPTAMYNLGVFYAHGWGGLQSNITIAKSLFVKAAELGQPDAKLALDNEAKSSQNIVYKMKNSKTPITNGNVNIKLVDSQPSKIGLFVKNLKNEIAENLFFKQQEYGTDVSFKTRVTF